MRALVKTIDGKEIELIGDQSELSRIYSLFKHKTGGYAYKVPPFLWLTLDNGEAFLNLTCVVSVQFFEMETEVGINESSKTL